MKKLTKNNLQAILGYAIIIGSVIIAGYLAGWLMFVKSIIALVLGFQAGTLTAGLIGWAIAKMILASLVSTVIISIGYYAGMYKIL